MIINYRFITHQVSIDLPNLYSIVYNLLKKIPKNKVTTYGEIAKALGDLRAARMIGRLMAKNIWYKLIPCYKVVLSDSSVGKYSAPGGVKAKIRKLINDRIPVKDGKIVNLSKYLWSHNNMDIFPYLRSLKRIQEHLSEYALKSTRYKLKSLCRNLVSCDVAYIDNLPDIAISSCILFTHKEISEISVTISPIYFPYIPGYLAFRELVPILHSLNSLSHNPSFTDSCILIDGHGLLHPRKFGIASHIGLLLNKPTIGIAKKLLVGRVLTDKPRKYLDRIYYPIILDKKILGYCVQKNNSKIYVSPGAYINLDSSLQLVLSLDWGDRKEPYLMILPHVISSYFRKHISNLIRMRAQELQNRSR